MNLIEKLGGYSGAKEYLNAMTDKSISFNHLNDREPFFKTDLEKALLEYRRKHNIYEQGDEILHPMFNSVFTIENVFNDYVVATLKSGYRTKLKMEVIEHATPEEIQAGRRLDQIKCWSCDKSFTTEQLKLNDGFCIYCNAEVYGE